MIKYDPPIYEQYNWVSFDDELTRISAQVWASNDRTTVRFYSDPQLASQLGSQVENQPYIYIDLPGQESNVLSALDTLQRMIDSVKRRVRTSKQEVPDGNVSST